MPARRPALLALLAALAGLARAGSPAAALDVRGFDADRDGKVSTDELQAAIDSARALRGTLYLPPGTYDVHRTLRVSQGSFDACRIQGDNTRGTVIRSHLRGEEPVFSFRGGWGDAGNAGLSNLTIEPAPGRDREGTGIYLDGLNFGLFGNLHIRRMRNAIWLHNDTPDPDPRNPDNTPSFSEMNQFSHVWIKQCRNGVRMQAGRGQQSFHGNVFDQVFMDIYGSDTGFNHLSGYYYNGRFRLYLWGHTDSVVYVNAGGKAELNTGDITYESQDEPGGAGPRLTGGGKFWFHGHFQGLGKVDDATAPRQKWTKVFACDNYWKKSEYGSSGLLAGPMTGQNRCDNGPLGFFQSLTRKDVNSVLLNTYDNSPDNGFYLGTSGFQKAESEADLGMFLAGDGSRIKTWNKRGLTVEGPALHVDGSLRVGAGGYRVVEGVVRQGAAPGRAAAEALAYREFIAGRLILSADPDGGAAPSATWELHGGADPKAGKAVPFAILPGGRSGDDTLTASLGKAGAVELGSTRPGKARDLRFVFMGVIR